MRIGEKFRRSPRGRSKAAEVLHVEATSDFVFNPKQDVNQYFVDSIERNIRLFRDQSATWVKFHTDPAPLIVALQYVDPEEGVKILELLDSNFGRLEVTSELNFIALCKLLPGRAFELRKYFRPQSDLSQVLLHPGIFSSSQKLIRLLALGLFHPEVRSKISQFLREHISDINQLLKDSREKMSSVDQWSEFAEIATNVLLLAPELKDLLNITHQDFNTMKDRLKTRETGLNIYDVARVIEFLTYYSAERIEMSENGKVEFQPGRINHMQTLPQRNLV